MRHVLVISHFNKGDTFFSHNMSTVKRHSLASFYDFDWATKFGYTYIPAER